MTVPRSLLDALKSAVGPAGWIEDEAGKAPYLQDVRGLFRGATPLVLRPADTGAVAAVVRLCAGAGVAVVPQSGNTGYVGGAIPDPGGDQVLLSLERMNRVRAVDPLDFTITVEAGCVLERVQAEARDHDRLFPLSLAAEGSCMIGGNLSTNAGGTSVLRYGNARDLVLGLEVVLPDGRTWDGLRRLRKDNTGYDLKQLFLGAEGTLGVITAAVLKLFPLPRAGCTAWVAVPGVAAATRLLGLLRERAGEWISSFEYIDRGSLELVLECMDGARNPLSALHAHQVLLEADCGIDEPRLREVVEAALAEALECGDVLDAVVAAGATQSRALWALREAIPEAQKRAGGCIKHDVSVPVSRVAEFVEAAVALSRQRLAGVRVVAFGHLGDGNIHFNLTQPAGDDAATFVARAGEITPAIHDLAMALGGSFSAEHGIGLLKRAELRARRPALELELMDRIRSTIDPGGIMNPGKLT